MSVLLPTPSWSTDIARSAAESAYPELWDGLSWGPMWENTGSQVVDIVTGYKSQFVGMNATAWKTSNIGFHLDFDGVDAIVDSNVEMDSTTATWSCWLRTTASENARVMSTYQVSPNGWMTMSVGGGNFSAFAEDTSNRLLRTDTLSPPAINDGKWHHCVQVLGIGTLTTYLDGKYQNQATDALFSQNINPSNQLVRLGYVISGTSEAYYSGDMAWPLVYKRALTAAEIAVLFSVPYAPFLPRDEPIFSVAVDVQPEEQEPTVLSPKPSYGSGFNKSVEGSLADGLMLFTAPKLGNTGDILWSTSEVGVANASLTWYEEGIDFQNSRRVDFGNMFLPAGSDFSYAGRFQWDAANQGYTLAFGTSGLGARALLALWSDSVLYFDVGGASGANRISVSISSVLGETVNVVARHSSQFGKEIWINGSKWSGNPAATGATSVNASGFHLAYGPEIGNYQEVKIETAGVWNRWLSTPEILALNEDPLAPVRQKELVPVSLMTRNMG